MCSNCDNKDFWLPLKGSTFVDKSYFAYYPSREVFNGSYFRTSVYVKAEQNGKLSIFNAIFLYNPTSKKREFIKILQYQEEVGNEKLVAIYNDLANKKYNNVIPNNLTMQRKVLGFLRNRTSQKNRKATSADFAVQPDNLGSCDCWAPSSCCAW